MRSRSKPCKVSGCGHPRLVKNFFCAKCWEKLPKLHRYRLVECWVKARSGDESAQRCAPAALRAALAELEQVKLPFADGSEGATGT